MTRIRFYGCDLSRPAGGTPACGNLLNWICRSESSYLYVLTGTRYLVFGLNVRLRIAVLLPIAAIMAAVAVGCALAARGSTTTHVAAGTGTPSQLEIGKQLYRKYCGQCHALIAALAAGFGIRQGPRHRRRPELQQPQGSVQPQHRRRHRAVRRPRARRQADDLGAARPGVALRRRCDPHQPVPRAYLRRLIRPSAPR